MNLRTHFRRILAAVGLASLAFTAAATAQAQTIGVSFQTFSNQHWVRWEKGIRTAVEPAGVKVVAVDAQYDSVRQIGQIEDLISSKVDLLIVVAVDGKAIKTALESAKKANIPVIIADIPVDNPELVTSTVATDNVLAGRLVGERLVKESGGNAKVAIVDYSPIKSVRDRVDGFLAAIKDSPGIEVVARQDALPSTEAVLPVVENFLQSNPEITDIFCINDLGAFAAINASKAANRSEIRIYGVDGNPDAAKAALKGEMIGTSAQFPIEMGLKAGEIALKILKGETVPKEVPVAAKFIAKENAQEYLDSVKD
jgi:ribose transport system substrate-binding protein